MYICKVAIRISKSSEIACGRQVIRISDISVYTFGTLLQIYWVGPVVGGILATLLFKGVLERIEEPNYKKGEYDH